MYTLATPCPNTCLGFKIFGGFTESQQPLFRDVAVVSFERFQMSAISLVIFSREFADKEAERYNKLITAETGKNPNSLYYLCRCFKIWYNSGLARKLFVRLIKIPRYRDEFRISTLARDSSNNPLLVDDEQGIVHIQPFALRHGDGP